MSSVLPDSFGASRIIPSTRRAESLMGNWFHNYFSSSHSCNYRLMAQAWSIDAQFRLKDAFRDTLSRANPQPQALNLVHELSMHQGPAHRRKHHHR